MLNKNLCRAMNSVLSVSCLLLLAGSATAATIAPAGAGTVGTLAVGGVDARFIEVVRSSFIGAGSDGVLAMAELEAFSFGATFVDPNIQPSAVVANPNDLALSVAAGGVATVTEVNGSFSHGGTDKLNDGIRNIGGDTWQRSPVSGEVRVRIDLGSTENVSTIRVWQRADGCCQGRLAEFSVNAYADNGFGAPGALLFTQFQLATVTPTAGAATFVTPDEATIHTGDILSIDLNGLANTSDAYQAGATGVGDLVIETGATLELNFVGSYLDFAVGQTYDLLDFGSITGSFDNIVSPYGVDFDYSNLLITGEITVLAVYAPEPSSLLIFGCGAICLAMRTRRRRNAANDANLAA